SRDDPKGRPTIFSGLPPLRSARWISIGRLDFNTSGLLLLTTDGQFANRMMHPSSQIEREYLCRVRGRINKDVLEKLRQGMLLDGYLARFCGIQKTNSEHHKGSNQWYQVVLREGRYREVRRLWQLVDCTVSRLIRIRYGTLVLPKKLAPGQFLELNAARINNLAMQ
ncbi:MAG TPA: pseudouridine synthase, partial [Gammaproteobacteria bacterium]|nr:pseudouridine synthase [Gammaproteobacteria bacterium]